MSWLTRLGGGDGTSRIVCLPYAGGGLSSYGDWTKWLPPHVELWVPDLPGREHRMLEEPVTDIGLLVAAIADDLDQAHKSTTLFGHSLGALVAFELARWLEARMTPACCLVVSGMSAPQTLTAGATPTDEEILLDLRAHGSAPPELYEQPDLLDLVMPGLRADYTMAVCYEYREGPRLSSTILALKGSGDVDVTSADLEAWDAQTLGPCETHVWDGGHMYLVDHAETVCEFVATRHLELAGA